MPSLLSSLKQLINPSETIASVDNALVQTNQPEKVATTSELVVVADKEGKILSLNDTIERVLHKSRSELLQTPLFEALIIKDANGTILNDPLLLMLKEPKVFENISLLTSFGMVKGSMQITPITEFEGTIEQISIIIAADASNILPVSNQSQILQEAVTRHDAMFEELKSKLEVRGQNDLKDKAIFIEKTEHDIRTVRELQTTLPVKKVPIDLATLCRETMAQEQVYARAFGVLLDFSFVNFGEADIKPLLSGPMPVSPEQLTGPFFTAPCDIKYLATVLQKLLDLTILIVPKRTDKTVRMTIERLGTTDLLIKVTCDNKLITSEELPKLFTPYYGELSNRTDLHFGSGLEGFIAKEISDQLRFPLQVNLTKDSERIVFLLWVNKGEESLATLASQQQRISS